MTLRCVTQAGMNPNAMHHTAGPWFNIKMSSYQYGKSHCGDKTVVRSSYLHNGISYAGKMSSLYWIRALVSSFYGRPYGLLCFIRYNIGQPCQYLRRRVIVRLHKIDKSLSLWFGQLLVSTAACSFACLFKKCILVRHINEKGPI